MILYENLTDVNIRDIGNWELAVVLHHEILIPAYIFLRSYLDFYSYWVVSSDIKIIRTNGSLVSKGFQILGII